jgi:subtilisin-like proprotein convertase family protein
MKPRKQPYLVNIGLAVAALCIGTAKSAETVIDWTNSGDIPDNNPTGFADTRSISLDSSLVITGLEVRLNLSGGWNGDLYATLVHDSGFSVLLNRPGTTFSNPAGSGSSGMNIVLSDNAASDIHTAIGSSGFITGTYQPDARTSDPALVTSSSPRSAFLSSFNETAVNGSWTLFLADDAEVDTSTLLGWGLTFTSESRPFVYWDANASGSGIGGSGTWSASGNSWATTNTGTSAAAANTASQLVFRGNTGTVTVAGTVAPQAGMRFESTGYELAGGGISLAGPDAASNRITAVSGVRASISSDLTGSNGYQQLRRRHPRRGGCPSCGRRADRKWSRSRCIRGHARRIRYHHGGVECHGRAVTRRIH